VRLAWVELHDFRNHARTRLDHVPDGLVVAVGPNGEGKTNLLEGMFYLLSLYSPRVSSGEALLDLMGGIRDHATAPTPPLESGSRAEEVATGVGSREST
jgi:hypothetical protein